MVRKVTVCCAPWWHGVSGATCIAIHISNSAPLLKKKRGAHPALNNLKIRHFKGSLRRLDVEEVRRGGGGGKE